MGIVWGGIRRTYVDVYVYEYIYMKNEKSFISSHSIKINDIVIKFYGYITRVHCEINCLLYSTLSL